MKERPILFSAPMVRAILAGTKTQTRRVVKPHASDDCFVVVNEGKGWWPFRSDDGESSVYTDRNGNWMEEAISCPYGQPGDRLWVRETCRLYVPQREGCDPVVRYAADGNMGLLPECFGHWDSKPCPSIHMPRWASRITLEVTGVRVERLQDISIEDAKAEGAWPDESVVEECASYFGIDVLGANPCRAFRMLWERINGPEAWDANPWVWVVEFRRLPC